MKALAGNRNIAGLWAGCLWLVACLLAGCASSNQNATSAAFVEWRGDAPDWSVLPRATVAKIKSYGQSVRVPEQRPFPMSEAAERAYSEGYREGYAYAFVTGNLCVSDEIPRADESATQQAKVLGWFDSISAGGLASIMRVADSHLKAMPRASSNRQSNP